MSPPPFLDAEAIAALLPPLAAVDALEAALRAGLDPEACPPRTSVPAGDGELLLMPSSWGGAVGAKLVTVAPDAPHAAAARGAMDAAGKAAAPAASGAAAAPTAPQGTLPRVQGLYVLFNAETLAPAVLIDGITLTTLRTSAVSALALRHLAAADAHRMVLFGTGPQAWAHVAAVRAVRPVERVDVLGRDRGRLSAFIARVLATGLKAREGTPESVAEADVVCCCTTAAEPLFDGERPPSHCSVVAIGSHRPDVREVDERLVGRATVVVEAVSSALREAGDLIVAIGAGTCEPEGLVPLDRLVRAELAVPPDRPRLFKSTGMSWEDAVLAEALWRRAHGR